MRQKSFYVPLLVGMGVVFLWWVFHSREPEHERRKLSEWVLRYCEAMDAASVPGKEEAAQAIQGIGAEAVPYLLKWIVYETPPRASDHYRKANEILAGINSSWRLAEDTDIRAKESRANAAMHAFVVLGPTDIRAVASLSKVLHDPNATFSAVRAARVLSSFGSIGLPPLREVLTNRQFKSALRYIVAAELIGTNAQAALRPMQQLLRDPDPGLRQVATNALRNIEPEARENTVH